MYLKCEPTTTTTTTTPWKGFQLSLNFPYDYETLIEQPGSSREAKFATALLAEVTSLAKVHSAQLRIDGITPGSIVVQLSAAGMAQRDAVRAAAGWLCIVLDGDSVCTTEAGFNTCAQNPCQHGGTCSSSAFGFKCTCSADYSGRDCSIATQAEAAAGSGTEPNSRIVPSSSATVGVIIGAAIGAVVLVTLIALLIKRRQPRKVHLSSNVTSDDANPITGLFDNPLFALSTQREVAVNDAIIIQHDKESKKTRKHGNAFSYTDSRHAPCDIADKFGISYRSPAYTAGGESSAALLEITQELEAATMTESNRWSVSSAYMGFTPRNVTGNVDGSSGPRVLASTDIVLGARIGAGQFAQIYVAEMCGMAGTAAISVAAKILPVSASASDEGDLLAEEAVLRSLPTHANVVRMLGSVVSDRPVVLALELMELGNMRALLLWARPTRVASASTPMRLSPRQILGFLADAAEGLSFLASRGIVHRNVSGTPAANFQPDTELFLPIPPSLLLSHT